MVNRYLEKIAETVDEGDARSTGHPYLGAAVGSAALGAAGLYAGRRLGSHYGSILKDLAFRKSKVMARKDYVSQIHATRIAERDTKFAYEKALDDADYHRLDVPIHERSAQTQRIVSGPSEAHEAAFNNMLAAKDAMYRREAMYLRPRMAVANNVRDMSPLVGAASGGLLGGALGYHSLKRD